MDNAYGDLSMLMTWADTCYFFPTYEANVRLLLVHVLSTLPCTQIIRALFVQGVVCKTNLPATTSVRAPGVYDSLASLAVQCL